MIVASHRQDRPWIGHVEEPESDRVPAYDAGCTFCPGNVRISGVRNPAYEGVLTFDNDHPCVGRDAPDVAAAPFPFRAGRAAGVARVICFHPRHDGSLASLGTGDVVRVLEACREQERSCQADPSIEHVLIFENRGEATGVSNPHPHGQLYATDFVMGAAATHARVASAHHRETGRSLLADVVDAEERDGRRVIASSGDVVAFVPYFARWAYEVLVVPRSPFGGIKDLDDVTMRDLAATLHEVLVRYDGLWGRPLPYVMTLHNSPLRASAPGFQFHVELQPPHRKPDLLKHLAGPEIGGGVFVADTSPEASAEELRG